jgi:hypothetical protein
MKHACVLMIQDRVNDNKREISLIDTWHAFIYGWATALKAQVK